MDINTRLIPAALHLEFAPIELNQSAFRAEFDSLSENNDDPIGMWLKNAKAKGKVIDENEPIMQLLVELHRKMDLILSEVSKQKREFVELRARTLLESIGHNTLICAQDCFESGCKYYGRLDIAVFPVRKMPMYFEAQDSKIAKIYLMHNRDIVDFDNYIAAKERALIREKKNICDKIHNLSGGEV